MSNVPVIRYVCPPELPFSGCFSEGFINNSASLLGNSVVWDIRVCAGRVSEWLPRASSRTRHRVSCSGHLCRSSNPVIQPLACAQLHCVYICNLTYPLGSHRPPLLPSSTIFILFLFSYPSQHFSPYSLIFTSFHPPLLFTQRYSQANTPTRFLTLAPIRKHMKGLEDKPCVRSCSLNVSGTLQPACFLCLFKPLKKCLKRIFPILGG